MAPHAPGLCPGEPRFPDAARRPFVPVSHLTSLFQGAEAPDEVGWPSAHHLVISDSQTQRLALTSLSPTVTSEEARPNTSPGLSYSPGSFCLRARADPQCIPPRGQPAQHLPLWAAGQ